MFSIDFDILFRRVLAFFLRKTLQLSLLGVFGAVLKQVNDELVELADATTFKLQWNNQVISLTEYLNTLYDPVLKRIYITCISNPVIYLFLKTEPVTQVVLYQKSEGQPSPVLITKGESLNLVDFIVFIPVSVVFDLTIITAQIQVYNAAGTRFKIETF